jgi:predicted dehydrogenase/threonine dehydrogenase-like Zn-dependent dehydrogenase
LKQVIAERGQIIVVDVPAPAVRPGHVLIETAASCISIGTELTALTSAGDSLLRRAVKRPDKVLTVLRRAATQGVRSTYEQVSTQLSAPTALGYSAAGIVREVGEGVHGFEVGQRACCVGVDVASHAELLLAPVNLAAVLPDGCATQDAATAAIGAIALQGVRRAELTLGETVLVIGLGLIGNITVQLLRASGCHTIGFDIDRERLAAAVAKGLDHGIDPERDDMVERVRRLTGGVGVDAIIITASAPGNSSLINDAIAAARPRGRAVIVGDVGLEIEREPFYRRELDLRISTSYGPGRYDPAYETEGRDYPIGQVRWTLKRNVEAYLDLLARRAVTLDGLPQASAEVDSAGRLYGELGQGGALCAFVTYPERAQKSQRTLMVAAPAIAKRGAKGERLGVGVIGGGDFAIAMHLPILARLASQVRIEAICGRRGARIQRLAESCGARCATSDPSAVINDPLIDIVAVTTRHDSHSGLTLAALKAGKHVLVEKPLGLRREEIAPIAAYFAANATTPVLLVGYNRRFAPAIAVCQQFLAGRKEPLVLQYRMNAGALPPDHWVFGPEGGGRNIGEACHVYDLANHLVGSVPSRVTADRVGGESHRDTFAATLHYPDGSLAHLVYSALGHASFPKETMEIHSEGKIISMSDFREVRVYGARPHIWSSKTQDKGHAAEWDAFLQAVRGERGFPIALDQLFAASEVSFDIEDILTGGTSGQ